MNELDRRSAKAAFWYVVSNVIAKSIFVLFTPILTRILSKDAYGEYSNFISWLHIIEIIFTLNLSSTILRAKLDYKEENTFNMYVFSVMQFSTVLPLVIGIIFVFPMHEILMSLGNFSKNILLAMMIIVIFSSQLLLVQAKDRALLRYKKVSIITVSYAITSIVFPLCMAYVFGNQIENIVWGLCIHSMLWGIVLLVTEYKQNHSTFDFGSVKYALKFGVPIIPHTLAGMLLGNSDKIMILSICGAQETAIYSVAYTCALSITLFRNSLGAAWSPWFYDNVDCGNLLKVKNATTSFVMMGFLGILFLALLAPEIIHVLGGNQYHDAVFLVPILMSGCFFNFLNVIYVGIEFYYKKTGMISLITILSASINIFLNYVGIHYWGYQAAAYATVVTSTLILLLHYFATIKYENERFVDNKMLLLVSLLSLIIFPSIHFLYNLLLLRLIAVLSLFIIISLRGKLIYNMIFEKSG